MESKEKEARFDIYCDSCKHKNLPGFEDPCDECLNNPAVDDSHKPMFHQKDGYYINYLEPDGVSYTRDHRKSHYSGKPTAEELKTYFDKREDGDYYEKPWN